MQQPGWLYSIYVSLMTCHPTIFIGPIYFGMSFLAHPLGMDRFFVDRYTRFPILNLGTMPFLLFAWYVCPILLLIMVLCAIAKFLSTCHMNVPTPRGDNVIPLSMQLIISGICP